MSRTLYQKIVDEHTIKRIDAQTVLLYCDVHFANEYTSPQAFAGLSSRELPAAVLLTNPGLHAVCSSTCAALRTERLSPTVFSTGRALNIFRSSLPDPTSAADPAESMLFGASFNSAFGR